MPADRRRKELTMLDPDQVIERRNQLELGILSTGYEIDVYAYGDSKSRLLMVREAQADGIHFYGFRDGPHGWHHAPIPYEIVAAHVAGNREPMIGEVTFQAAT
jgi:hypothetical protein